MNKHILIVDDEKAMRSTVYGALEAEGYLLSEACDGQEALDKLLKLKGKGELPDLIITDYQMPRLSGIGFIDQLKQREIDIPVLVMTGCCSEDVTKMLSQRGIFNYLEKPFTFQKLLQQTKLLLASPENG